MNFLRNWPRILFGGVFVSLFLSSLAFGQWRVKTPRDTITVAANKKVMTASKMTLTAGVEIQLWVAGIYKELLGQAQFDGGYVLVYPGWTLPQPMRTTPPYFYNSARYDFGLKYSNSAGISEAYFVPSESTYQSSHLYTLKVPSIGNALQFYIKAPDDTYYPKGQDNLLVRMARWTAGICEKSTDINFGNVLIGATKNYLDSIASYGIDPLRVDSIEIIGPDAAAFSYISQRVTPFTLPNELANEIKIIFTPQKQGTASARLHIISKNTDLPSRDIYINLSGLGEEPTLDVRNREIDFGKVRIGYPATKNGSIFNGGNATLILDSLKFRTAPPPDSVFGKAASMPIPNLITPGSTGQVRIVASPLQRIKYEGMCYIFGNNNLRDSIKLSCEGAAPLPVLNPDSVIDFGPVYSGDVASKPLTLTNKGNWPINCVKLDIEGAARSAFAFAPADSQFIVEPDSVRNFTIIFSPGTRTERNLRAYLVFYYDDLGRDSILLNGDEKISPLTSDQKIHNFGTRRIGISKTDTITNFTNTGNIPAPIDPFIVTPSIPFSVQQIYSVAAHTTIPVFGTFTPIVPGAVSAWLFYSSSGKRDSILLQGIGAVAKAIFDPAPLDYGIIATGTPSTKTVTLSDSGNWPLKIMWYEITGADKSDFTVRSMNDPSGAKINTLPYAVIEGTKITFDIQFVTNAKTGAVHRAQLCLHYDDSSSDCLDLQAIEEKQYVQFATPGINFDKIRVKTHKQKTARFRNGSNLTLNVGNISISSPSDAFTILDTLKPIPPQSPLNVSIDFYPQLRGHYQGFFKADSADFKTDSIELKGIGAAPFPRASDTLINFGVVALAAQKTMPFYILNQNDTNNTDWPMNVARVWLRGDKHNEFSWESNVHGKSNTNDSLGIGEISSYTATFTPNTTIIYHSADLVFTLDDSSELVVHLVGLDESPNLVLGEDTLRFGRARIGQPPVARDAHLVNTWTDTLTAGNVHIEQAGNEFNPPTFNTVVVPPNLPTKTKALNITFTPAVRGKIFANLISSGKDAVTDTTVLEGEGAAPLAKFTPDTVLDFGPVLYGTNTPRTFELKNIGNWIFSTIDVSVTGVNMADFTTDIAKLINIEEDSARTFTVTFFATTPIQAAERTATLVFTLDDSTKVTYELRAHDRAPLATDLRFDNASARTTDARIFDYLRLVTEIPDSLNVNHTAGTIIYDPAVVMLEKVSLASSLPIGWTLTEANPPSQTPGTYSYDLKSPTLHLNKPSALLQLIFRPADGVLPNAKTNIAHSDFKYPDTKEVQAILSDGVIVIDSACGDTHLTNDPVTGASYIRQNHPNPFGISSGSTHFAFAVGADEAAVTIRILDVSGKEVLRLLDNAMYKHGNYDVMMTAEALPAGTYFYEFHTANDKPQIRKMVLEK
jgi:hypothetical protein